MYYEMTFEKLNGYAPIIDAILGHLRQKHPKGVYKPYMVDVPSKKAILILEAGPGLTKKIIPEPIAEILINSGHLIPESFDGTLLPQDKLEELVTEA